MRVLDLKFSRTWGRPYSNSVDRATGLIYKQLVMLTGFYQTKAAGYGFWAAV